MFGRNLLDGLPADVKARLRNRAQPRWVAPMLATLTDEVFSRQGWLFEPKWDGERCLAFRRGRDLNLFSRNRIRLNTRYPEVVEAICRQQTTSFIADGEIVTFDGAITSFAKLQARMQVQHPSADLIRKVPVWFYVFDLLYLDRYDIRQVPLRYRKEVLRNAFDFRGCLRFTQHVKTEGEAYYRRACQKGWEGVIAKNGDSAYVSRRTRDWLKFKCKQEQEFVIGGYTDPRGSRSGFGTCTATTSGRFRSGTGRKYFAMPSIFGAACGSRSTSRLKARPTTDGRARRDGKVSSQKMGTARTCPGERAIGSNSSASKNRSSSSAVTPTPEEAAAGSEHCC